MSADKQYDRQFLAWAVDRSLRFYEVNKQTCSQQDVTNLAEYFCAWIMPAPDAEPEPTSTTEEERLAMAEHDKHLAAASGNGVAHIVNNDGAA